MHGVYEGLKNIESYVNRRMNRLSRTLEGQANRTIQCPECEQWALLLGPGREECLFCGGNGLDAMHWRYMDAHPDLAFLVTPCPQCDEETLVDDVEFADSSPHRLLYCFSCAARYSPSELAPCTACGRRWPVEGDDDGTTQTLCQGCAAPRRHWRRMRNDVARHSTHCERFARRRGVRPTGRPVATENSPGWGRGYGWVAQWPGGFDYRSASVSRGAVPAPP
ncbi:hypothetical protein OG729_10025 [Streptomyces sp. NBC_00210]|uniref:hypothetical protein n=1 Tax=Streptomyces sp. NBC_00210 TaxID=2903636 RepID=UPI00324863D1